MDKIIIEGDRKIIWTAVLYYRQIRQGGDPGGIYRFCAAGDLHNGERLGAEITVPCQSNMAGLVNRCNIIAPGKIAE